MSTINAAALYATLLAAEGDPFRGMGAGFRGENAQFQWADAVFIGGLIAALPVLLWILARLLPKGDKLRHLDSPPLLLRQLARAQGLDRGDRRLLVKLAAARQLPHPGLLFMEPRLFDLEGLPEGWRKRADRLRTLQAQLFEQPTPPAA